MIIKNFNVLVEKNKSSITAEITSDSVTDRQYYFYLLKDGQVISKHGWYTEPKYSWDNLESGRYQVRGFCRSDKVKIDKFSESIVILNEDIDKLFSNLLNDCLAIPELIFSPSTAPHQDILVIHDCQVDLDFPGFTCTTLSHNSKTQVFHRIETVSQDANSNQIIFSGSAFYKDQLIFGQNEALHVNDKFSLIDSQGDFVCCLLKENKLVLTNDYFGVQKIFFFQNKDIFLASNRVHFLLLGMAANNIDFKMDSSVVRATLSSGYVQPFQQVFSQGLMVQGVKLLPIDQRIIIDDGIITFEPKPISDLLADNVSPVREDEYEHLIEKGIQDVVRQTVAVMNHPKFKTVVFDATGGMDSRLILAAAARCDESRKKISINAMDTLSIPLDIRVACQVASALQFKHDESPEIVEVFDEGYHKLGAISQLLGTYYAYDLRKRNGEMVTREDGINVTGFFGEICLRPYYSRSYLSKNNSQNKPMDKLEFYEFLLKENKSGLTNIAAQKDFHKLLIESIKILPGSTPLEKYDLHYLFYRNGFHCSDIFRMKWNTPRVGIIQSKNLFLLKRKLYGRSPNTLLQNDVIARIYPDILSIPYASSRDNDDLVQASLFSKNKSLKTNNVLDITELSDGKSAALARSRKKITKVNIEIHKSDHFDLINIARKAIVKLTASTDLIDPDLCKEILISLKSDAFPWVMANKVLMAYYMWLITKISPQDVRNILLKSFTIYRYR